MTARPDPEPYLYDPDRCPFTATWNVIGGKWKGLLWWRAQQLRGAVIGPIREWCARHLQRPGGPARRAGAH